ncbi:MAG: hypothetical protein AB7R89_19300 [Dehalococcoidia bacterium]
MMVHFGKAEVFIGQDAQPFERDIDREIAIANGTEQILQQCGVQRPTPSRFSLQPSIRQGQRNILFRLRGASR